MLPGYNSSSWWSNHFLSSLHVVSTGNSSGTEQGCRVLAWLFIWKLCTYEYDLHKLLGGTSYMYSVHCPSGWPFCTLLILSIFVHTIWFVMYSNSTQEPINIVQHCMIIQWCIQENCMHWVDPTFLWQYCCIVYTVCRSVHFMIYHYARLRGVTFVMSR